MQEPSESQQEYHMFKQQQENDPNTLYADSMREDKVKNILEQINPSALVEEIYHKLRGEKFNSMTQQWEAIAEGVQPLHPVLISRFVSYLGSILNQNTTLSNYSIHEINNRMSNIIEWIARDLPSNAEEYGLQGRYTEWERIGNIVCETCSSVFRRALNGMESKRIFNAWRVSENLTPAKSGGMKEAFKFW